MRNIRPLRDLWLGSEMNGLAAWIKLWFEKERYMSERFDVSEKLF